MKKTMILRLVFGAMSFLFVNTSLACPDISGTYQFKKASYPENTITIKQNDCASIDWRSVTKSPEGDEFTMDDHYDIDGINRRMNDPAPYASYEMMEWTNTGYRSLRLNIQNRRGNLVHNSLTYDVNKLASGDLQVIRTVRDDNSKLVSQEERVFQKK